MAKPAVMSTACAEAKENMGPGMASSLGLLKRMRVRSFPSAEQTEYGISELDSEPSMPSLEALPLPDSSLSLKNHNSPSKWSLKGLEIE